MRFTSVFCGLGLCLVLSTMSEESLIMSWATEELKFASVSDIDIPFSYLVSTEKHNFRKQGKRGWKSGGIKEDMPALAHDLAEHTSMLPKFDSYSDSCLPGMHLLGGKKEGKKISHNLLFLSVTANCQKMGKIWVEVCLISARGLRRTSSLFKLQWYAVGWIDPNNKYCSRIDASGNANPVWKTKFSALVDTSESEFQDLALQVEVYSRDPIFLRERLQGTATVVLKEFLDKYVKSSEVSKPVEEVGSFQLRRRNSNKPQGFVDVSIRISEEREEPSSYTGNGDGFKLMDHNTNINISNQLYGMSQPPPPQFPLPPHRPPENQPPPSSNYAYPMPLPGAYSNSSLGGPSHQSAGGPSYQSVGGPSYPPAGGPSYQPPRTPPPPPSNIGYLPTFLPRTDYLPPSYINMPPSGRGGGTGGGGGGRGFGMGLGAGALAAGAVIFGDDYMSGFDVPAGFQDASLTIVTDPPF
ncbi:hypothetical protein RHGRI_027733 [Rhododendron griersonianum]|uniref:C2 domain-containing protein n=1 Tax=Rhododendron griersonianum TaxID=479676 RepID=A0AAV6J1J7_9ERIC|nr:hypothetical protein RHGRI_027733 [Rhododendron griersonianum]